MRQVTLDASIAFRQFTTFSSKNTKVKVEDGEAKLYLHGNLIARNTGKEILITNAGWHSQVTKERLNGLMGVSITQKKGDWYLNGTLWDGNWIKAR